MNILHQPWLELAVVVNLLGCFAVSRVQHPGRVYGWSVAFIGATFGCTVLAWLAFYLEVPADSLALRSFQPLLFGRQIFVLDELNAPLVPTVALLHLLVAMSTSRTFIRKFSFSWSMATEMIRLLTFSCKEPWVLIVLLAISTVPPYVELRNRRRPTGVFVLHMALFVGLLVIGWSALTLVGDAQATAPWWAALPLLMAILVRCGTVPAHCWVTDLFEHASLGIALLFVIPLPGVYAAVRLLLPIGPGWVLQSIGLLSLITAVYAAGMAVVQREARRFCAHLFLSHSSLVLVGLELHTSLSLTASLCLWFSVILSLGGFGLTLNSLEARFGRLSLSDFHGLYEHAPTLAVRFLLTGLASVGFPGTLGFISTELLVDSAGRGQSLHRHYCDCDGGLERDRGHAGLFLAFYRRPPRFDRFTGNWPAGARGRSVVVGTDPGRWTFSAAGRCDAAPRAEEILENRGEHERIETPNHVDDAV